MLISETDPMYASYGCGLIGCDQSFQVLRTDPQPANDPVTGEPLRNHDGTPLLIQVSHCDGEASSAQLAAHRESDCTGTVPEPPAAPNAATPGAEVVVTGDGSRYLMTVSADGARRVDQIGR